MQNRFSAGDHIEVTCAESLKGTAEDVGTLRGTALDTREHVGRADFEVLVSGNVMRFNLNRVEVTNLYRAKEALDTVRDHRYPSIIS